MPSASATSRTRCSATTCPGERTPERPACSPRSITNRSTASAASVTPTAVAKAGAPRRAPASPTHRNPHARITVTCSSTPMSVTMGSNPHTPSARAPSSRRATALKGRRGVPCLRPKPTRAPAVAEVAMVPTTSARRSGVGRTVIRKQPRVVASRAPHLARNVAEPSSRVNVDRGGSSHLPVDTVQVPMRALRPALLAVAICAAAPLAAQRSDVREITTTEQVLHVLNRLAYGPRPGDVERVRAMGVDRWVAAQLEPERMADTAADAVVARYATLHAAPGELARLYETVRRARQSAQRDAARAGDTSSKREIRREALTDDPQLRELARRAQRVGVELQSAKLARAVVSDRQLQEVMVDFWENHFSVFAGKGPVRFYLTEYDRDVIRPHAFGKFRDLLGAVAQSPAMLFYLDNWQSRADSLHPTLAGNGQRAAGAEQLREALQRATRADGTIDASRLPRAMRRRWERMPAEQRERLQNGMRQLAQRRPSGL